MLARMEKQAGRANTSHCVAVGFFLQVVTSKQPQRMWSFSDTSAAAARSCRPVRRDMGVLYTSKYRQGSKQRLIELSLLSYMLMHVLARKNCYGTWS